LHNFTQFGKIEFLDWFKFLELARVIGDFGARGEAFESNIARHSTTKDKAFPMVFFKKLIFWAILGGIIYFFLSYHIIYINKSLKLLKKSELTLEYTFYSVDLKNNKAILSVGPLRKDGIGDLLIETGRMTEEEMERLLDKIEENDRY
jgi:hypothetical protein